MVVIFGDVIECEQEGCNVPEVGCVAAGNVRCSCPVQLSVDERFFAVPLGLSLSGCAQLSVCA